jgi:hypothetical protein
MDARDWLALIGLALLGGGLWFVFWPAALAVPGLILTFYALVSLRVSGPAVPDQADSDHHPDR